MANLKGKSVDTTRLSVEAAVDHGWIHRDYLAHCLRYSHVVKYLHGGNRYKTANVLDIGCGGETPLAKTMFHNRLTHTSGSYTGIDYGRISNALNIGSSQKFNMSLHEKTDYVKFKVKKKPDVIVCFEVLEHVEPMHAYEMLVKMGEDLAENGIILISTPVYSVEAGPAANHVNEMSYAGLEFLITAAKLEIAETFGTFASIKDYKKDMSAAQQEVFEQLREYYDTNVLSCFMAPMFPEKSRNCLWILKKPDAAAMVDIHNSLDTLTPDIANQKHSSSDRWSKDVQSIIKKVNGKLPRSGRVSK